MAAVTPPLGIWKRDAHNLRSTWTVPLANNLNEDVEIGAVQTDMNLKEAQAAQDHHLQSAQPKNLLPKESIVEGEAKRRGVKYGAANGAKTAQ